MGLTEAQYDAWLAAVRAIKTFEIEVWCILAVSMAFILARLLAQLRTFGWKLHPDDFLVVLAGACFVVECFAVIKIDKAGGTSFKMTDAERLALTAEQVSMYSLGQKWYLVGLSFYISTLWLLKGTMLFLLKRVTRGLKQEKLISFSAILVAISWIALQCGLFLNCMPFDDFFQVLPQPSPQCQGTSAVYYIPTLALNVSTDLFIMAIPIPLLWQIQISKGKKLILACLFCGGIFIIIASTLRTVMSLTSLSQTFTTFAWSVREIFVAIIVTNAAVIKPIFNNAKSFTKKSSYGYGYGYGTGYGRRSRDLERGKVVLQDPLFNDISSAVTLHTKEKSLAESTITLPTKTLEFPGRKDSLTYKDPTPGLAF